MGRKRKNVKCKRKKSIGCSKLAPSLRDGMMKGERERTLLMNQKFKKLFLPMLTLFNITLEKMRTSQFREKANDKLIFHFY